MEKCSQCELEASRDSISIMSGYGRLKGPNSKGSKAENRFKVVQETSYDGLSGNGLKRFKTGQKEIAGKLRQLLEDEGKASHGGYMIMVAKLVALKLLISEGVVSAEEGATRDTILKFDELLAKLQSNPGDMKPNGQGKRADGS